jgi:flagellar basal body-associated protein FliL
VGLYDWAVLISAIILLALGGLLVFQFGYSRGRWAAEKEAKRAQADPIFPEGRILPSPERPS